MILAFYSFNKDLINKMPNLPGSCFMCSYPNCGRRYTQTAHLKRHVKVTHLKEVTPLVKCTFEDCNKKFSHKYNMKRHVRRVHGKPYRCEPCSKTFKKHSNYKAHMLQHSNLPGYQCDACGVKFFSERQLKGHKKRHEKYRCEVDGCSFKVDKWSALRSHKVTAHHREHECSTCKLKFRHRCNLYAHEKIHQETRKVFECPEDDCCKYYYHQKNLRAHIQASHEGKLIECSVKGCDKKFKYNKSLIFHLKTHGGLIAKKKKKKKKRATRKDKGIPKKLMIERLLGKQYASELSTSSDEEVMKDEKELAKNADMNTQDASPNNNVEDEIPTNKSQTKVYIVEVNITPIVKNEKTQEILKQQWFINTDLAENNVIKPTENNAVKPRYCGEAEQVETDLTKPVKSNTQEPPEDSLQKSDEKTLQQLVDNYAPPVTLQQLKVYT